MFSFPYIYIYGIHLEHEHGDCWRRSVGHVVVISESPHPDMDGGNKPFRIRAN